MTMLNPDSDIRRVYFLTISSITSTSGENDLRIRARAIINSNNRIMTANVVSVSWPVIKILLSHPRASSIKGQTMQDRRIRATTE